MGRKETKNPVKLYIIVFWGCFILKCVSLFGAYEMKLVSDNIGVLLVPATLAGRDWSGITGSLAYYGWGYYILFTPLFMITDNPYIIYYVICFVNICTVSASGVLIYHIISTYFSINNKYGDVLLAIICSAFAIIIPSNFTNETPALIAVWFIAAVLTKCYMNCENKRKHSLFTLLLIATLMWAALIHTRLLVLWVAVCFSVFAIRLLLRQWIVRPAIFIIGSCAGYLCAENIKNVIISTAWSASNTNGLRNAQLLTADRLAAVSTTLKVAVDIVISNIYKLIIETYGFSIICLLILFIGIKKILDIQRKSRSINLTSTEFLCLIYICVFGLTILFTIIGLPVNYGTGIAQGYSEQIENARFSGLTYSRYYLIYFGPVFISCVWILHNKLKWFKNLKLWVTLIILVIAIYIGNFVLPHLNTYYTNFILNDFVKNDIYKLNFIITIFIIIILALLWCHLISKNKVLYIIIILAVTMLFDKYNISGSAFFHLNGPSGGGESLYEILGSIEDKEHIPETIYLMDNTSGLAKIQFMLNDFKLQMSYPDNVEEAIIYTNSAQLENFDMLEQDSFKLYHLGGQEVLGIKGENLQNILESSVSTLVGSEQNVLSDELKYGAGVKKVGDIIIQMSEIDSISYTLSNPLAGEYQLNFNFDMVSSPKISFGYIEVWQNESLILYKELLKDDADNQQYISCNFVSNSMQEITVKLFLDKYAVIKDLNMNYCLDN